MKLTSQRRLAAAMLKCSPKRVHMDGTKMAEIKEAITRADVRGLIIDKFIIKTQARGTSRARVRKRTAQRSKRRQKGYGSKKGKSSARIPQKEKWMQTVRIQRELLHELKEKKMLTNASYRDLYRKSKGGFFRSKRHLKLYIDEHHLIAGKEK